MLHTRVKTRVAEACLTADCFSREPTELFPTPAAHVHALPPSLSLSLTIFLVFARRFVFTRVEFSRRATASRCSLLVSRSRAWCYGYFSIVTSPFFPLLFSFSILCYSVTLLCSSEILVHRCTCEFPRVPVHTCLCARPCEKRVSLFYSLMFYLSLPI